MISKFFLSFLILLTVSKISATEKLVRSGEQEYTGPLYQAALFVYFENADNPRFCAGSLISEYTVLTAARCVINENYIKPRKILVNLAQNDLKVGGYVYAIVDRDQMIVHPDFTIGKVISNDIALLRLPRKVGLNNDIKIIELDLSNENHVDETATVSGWGYKLNNQDVHYKLRFGNVKIISNDKCSTKINNIGKTDVCAISTFGDDSVCFGDAGGPLIANGKQIGINSFLKKSCQDPFYPSVYLRLSEYRDWITENSGQNLFASKLVFVSILAVVFFKWFL